jgi:integrase/recombinase XerD
METLSVKVEAFLQACFARRLRPSTREWYAWLLGDYTCYIENKHLPWDAPETIDAFMAYLAGRDISAHTLHAYYRTLRRFFNWLEKRNDLGANPIRKVDAPLLPRRRIPRGIEPSAVTQLLDAIDPSDWYGKRDRAIVLLLWDTGARAGELCDLEMRDLDLERGRVLIRCGKGEKDRYIVIGQCAQQALAEWLDVRLRNGKTPSHVFLNRSENQLTRRGLTSLLCRRCRKAGVEGPDNPHAFRHGFAVAYLNNGGKIHTLQRLMGHETLRSTEVYLWASDRDALEDHAQASPADNLS